MICSPRTVQGGRVAGLVYSHFRRWTKSCTPPAQLLLPLRFPYLLQRPPGRGDSEAQQAGCHLKPQEEQPQRGRAAGVPEGGICKSPYVNTGTPSQPSSSAALPGAVWLSCPHGDRDRAVAQGCPLPLGSVWHPDLPPPGRCEMGLAALPAPAVAGDSVWVRRGGLCLRGVNLGQIRARAHLMPVHQTLLLIHPLSNLLSPPIEPER